MKLIDSKDVALIGKRAHKRLEEIKLLMLKIDERARSKGCSVRDNMTHMEVNTLYSHGESAIRELISTKSANGKQRNVSAPRFGT